MRQFRWWEAKPGYDEWSIFHISSRSPLLSSVTKVKGWCWFPRGSCGGGVSFFCSTHRHLLSSDSISVYLLLHILCNLHKVCIIMPIMWVSWGSEQLNDLPEATLVPQSPGVGSAHCGRCLGSFVQTRTDHPVDSGFPKLELGTLSCSHLHFLRAGICSFSLFGK